jgi:uncharacterized DUF497 family protein
MKIVWDEPKPRQSRQSRLDLADFNETFFKNAIVLPSHGNAKRWIAVGVNIRDVVVVVFARRGRQGREHHQHAARKPPRKETL